MEHLVEGARRVNNDEFSYARACERREKTPREVRCTECYGLGRLLERLNSGTTGWAYNPCMQCASTGLTPICSAEVIKGRSRDKTI